MNFNEIKNDYKELGYYMDDDLAKKVFLFENSANNSNMAVPTMLLTGQAGSGKTSLAEIFSKKIDANYLYMQCVPGMGIENMQMEPNIEAILKKDPDNAVKKGLLIRALESSKEKATVVLLDEIDKTRPDVDSFLLDFIQNGRVSTGSDEFKKGDFPIYLIMTSNDERDLSDALLNRTRNVDVPRLSREKFLECLNLPNDHYLGSVYDRYPSFTIRQAQSYLNDLKSLGDVKIDFDALEQYIGEQEINSLKDFERVGELGEFIDVNGVKMIDLNIDSYPKILEIADKLNISITSDVDSYGNLKNKACIRSAKQLVEVEKYINDDEDSYNLAYSGYVEVEEEDIEGATWSNNSIGKVKIGFKVRNGERPLDIIQKTDEDGKCKYFVRVDSESGNVHSLESIKKYEKSKEKEDEIGKY